MQTGENSGFLDRLEGCGLLPMVEDSDDEEGGAGGGAATSIAVLNCRPARFNL